MRKSLKLWRFDDLHQRWVYERNVEPENAEEWLAIFQRGRPSAKFKISAMKPTFRKPSRPRVPSMISRTAFVRRHIPGHPVGIPSDALVEVEEERRQRGGPTRVRVAYRGSSYWVDQDDLRLPSTGDRASRRRRRA